MSGEDEITVTGDGAHQTRAELDMPGLVLESWLATASSRWRRAKIPWAVACAPIKAFRRHGSLDRALCISPLRVLLFTLGWHIVLLVAGVGIHYGLDVLRGVRYVHFGYWNYPNSSRFGIVRLLPINVVIAWMQCLVVVVIGIVIAARGLTVRRTLRLTTWLVAFTLVAGLADALYRVISNRWLYDFVAHSSGQGLWLFNIVIGLRHRIGDIVLGFLAGLAVGTVLQRRRWFIAAVSATALAAALPVYNNIQFAYIRAVCLPLHQLSEPKLEDRVALAPTILKIPGYEQHINGSYSRSEEEAVALRMPTSWISYLIEPAEWPEATLEALRAHLTARGWIALRYDPLNVHVDMLTGDAKGWWTGISGVTAPPGVSGQWGGWWVRDGEAINVHLTHGTPPDRAGPYTGFMISLYRNEAVDDNFRAYRQQHGELPGEAPPSEQNRRSLPDEGC